LNPVSIAEPSQAVPRRLPGGEVRGVAGRPDVDDDDIVPDLAKVKERAGY